MEPFENQTQLLLSQLVMYDGKVKAHGYRRLMAR